jgi:hypothetical protein
VKSEYHIISKTDARQLAKRLASDGELIEPMVDLIENSRIAVEEMFDYLGRITLETVLLISASNVAGQPHQGRKGAGIVRHGSQKGVVSLGDRKIRVQMPRLRERGEDGGREIAIPAYEAMKSDDGFGAHILKTISKTSFLIDERGLHQELRGDTSGGLRMCGCVEVKRVKGVRGEERGGVQKAFGASLR